MRFLRIGSRVLCGCLFLLVASGGVAENESQFASEFKTVFENLLKDKDTAKWVDKVLYDLIRHGLDRKTANIIANDEFVKKNRHLIDATMREAGDYARNMLRARGAEASYADNKAGVPSQYAGIRNAAQRLAKFFNFSKEMRSNLNVFVLGSPTVNALAYGSLDTIEIALFTGLIERLNEAGDPITAVSEMVKGTIAHELAHVKNRHVEQRMVVISIFLASEKNVIPASMQENYRALLKDQAMRSLYGIDPQQALSSPSSDLYRELFDHSWDMIERLAEDMRMRAEAEPEKFEALVEKLNQTFRSYDAVSFLADADAEAKENTTPRQLSETEAREGQKLLARYGIEVSVAELLDAESSEAKPEEASEAQAEEASEAKTDIARAEKASGLLLVDLLRFMEALDKLSRSHEVTSDRFEQIATSERAVQRSMARLGGGHGASPEAMMQQAEKWARELNRNPKMQKSLNERWRSHPTNLMRIYQAMLFSKSTAFKVHQLPIYKALTLYMEGIKMVEKSERVMEGESNSQDNSSDKESVADSKEAYELYLETEKATPFTEMVRNFGKVIADSIIAADATSVDDLDRNRFAELVDYLQELKRDRGNQAIPKKRLYTPGTEEKIEGLLYTISYRLRHLELPEGSEGEKLIKDALELLKPFQPVGSTWQLDKRTGRPVLVENSSDDANRRRLEDFRRRARDASATKKAAETARRRR